MINESVFLVWAPRMLSVLRIVAGLLFVQHGMVKLLGFPVAGPGPWSIDALRTRRAV